VIVVVDTSALVACALGEPDFEVYASLLIDAESPLISAPNWLEFQIVMANRKNLAPEKAERWLEAYDMRVIAFTSEMSKAAGRAHQRFGKGRHPAALNFGDCCAYATAKLLNLPLLFKGNDFSQTDVQAAV
jgi:ribonuclease VapC